MLIGQILEGKVADLERDKEGGRLWRVEQNRVTGTEEKMALGGKR